MVDDRGSGDERDLTPRKHLRGLLLRAKQSSGLIYLLENGQRTSALLERANKRTEVTDHPDIILGPEVKLLQDIALQVAPTSLIR